jgi:hypothetical protein
MCDGFLNCPKGQKREGKNKIFLSFILFIESLFSCLNGLINWLSLFLALQVTDSYLRSFLAVLRLRQPKNYRK